MGGCYAPIAPPSIVASPGRWRHINGTPGRIDEGTHGPIDGTYVVPTFRSAISHIILIHE